MSGIDLHTHSTASDGTESPAAVITSARRAGLEVIALTDHDTAHGWDEAAAAAARHGVGLVRGMEISCSRYGRSIHLLGYLVDPDHPGLATEIGYAREARVNRLRRMVEKMAADGIPLSYEQVVAQVDAQMPADGPAPVSLQAHGGIIVTTSIAAAARPISTTRAVIPERGPSR